MAALSLPASPCDTALPPAALTGAPLWDTAAAARADAGTLDMTLVTSRAAFDALEDDWNGLFERSGRSGQLFQSFNWLWHWANHFLVHDERARTTLAVVTGRRNGRLVVVCPFVRIADRGMVRLNFMGDPVSQYGDVLAEGGEHALADIRAAWSYALRETGADLIHLRKVRADAAITPLLSEIGSAETDGQVAPYVAFDGATDYSKFEQRYSPGARRNRRRQMRRLEERGPTAFDRLGEGEAARDAVSLALTMKRGWLKERGLVSAALSDPRTEAFFRDCAMGGEHATGLRVGLVRCNGEVAAVELTLDCKDRVAIHVIAYNLTFEKTGAGSLLMEDSIRRACQEGRATFDLLAPGATYKFDWADRSCAVKDHAIGLSPLGRLYAALFLKRLRPAAKHALEHMPMALRRHLSSAFGALAVAGL